METVEKFYYLAYSTDFNIRGLLSVSPFFPFADFVVQSAYI